jgi:hypothetical protein
LLGESSLLAEAVVRRLKERSSRRLDEITWRRRRAHSVSSR